MSKKRFVVNPGAIAVVMQDGKTSVVEDGEPMQMTISRYVREFLVNDTRFGKSRTLTHRAADLAEAFCQNLAVYEVDEADWKVLSEAADEPQREQAFTTSFFRQMRPFNDAICDAKNEAPKAKVAPALPEPPKPETPAPALANGAALTEAVA